MAAKSAVTHWLAGVNCKYNCSFIQKIDIRKKAGLIYKILLTIKFATKGGKAATITILHALIAMQDPAPDRWETVCSIEGEENIQWNIIESSRMCVNTWHSFGLVSWLAVVNDPRPVIGWGWPCPHGHSDTWCPMTGGRVCNYPRWSAVAAARGGWILLFRICEKIHCYVSHRPQTSNWTETQSFHSGRPIISPER